MKSSREIQVSKRLGRAWDALSSGYPEQAFNIINEGKSYEYSKELSKQLHWWQNYKYPELKNINRDIRRELALVISWNTLLGDYWKWALKESLAPLVGVDYGFNVDFNKIKDEIRFFQPSPSWSDDYQHYESWHKLPNHQVLSLSARSLFILIMKHAQVNFGGLTDTRYLGPIETDEISSSLHELAKHNLISIKASNNDLLISETVVELKKFAFENGLKIQGSKHQIIQAIFSEMQEEKIKQWLDEKGKLDLPFIRPLVADVKQLKKHTWIASEKIDLYLKWLYERKYLGTSSITIANERDDLLEARRYKPLEPWRPLLINQVPSHIWESVKTKMLQDVWDYECDNLLRAVAIKYAWDWELFINDALVAQLSSEKLAKIRKACDDEMHLLYFCEKRLSEWGVDVYKPETVKCAGCGISFKGWSVDRGLAKRVGYKILFCKECYSKAFWESRNRTTSADKMLACLLNVSTVMEIIPTSSFFNKTLDLSNLEDADQILIVNSLIEMPPYREYIKIFGTWLRALRLAGILEGDAQRVSRGIKCIAKDGHACNSLAEKTIDDWLSSHNIGHEKEPEYPYHIHLNTNKMRADWKVHDIMIEYAGMMSEPSYAAKMRAKQELAKELQIPIIVLEPEDVLNLDEKLNSVNHGFNL